MATAVKEKLYHLLRWSQRFTKTDMLYLVKGGFWFTSSNAMNALLGFVLTIAFANLLPKEIYGTYRYLLSIASLIAICTLREMDIAVIQAVARGFEGSLKRALRTRIAWGTLGTVVGLGVSIYYQLHGNTALAVGVMMVSVFAPLMESFTVADSLLQGRKLFALSSKYRISNRIIASATMLTALLATDNLYILLGAYLIPWTVLRLFQMTRILSTLNPNNQVDRETISYGKQLSFVNILSTITNYLDQLLIFHLLGSAELAVYSMALKPVEQIKSLLKFVNDLALPKFAKQDKSIVSRGLKRKLLTFGLVVIFIILLYIPLIPLLYRFVFPLYLESIHFTQILSISLLATPLFLIVSYFNAQKMVKELYQFNTAVAVFQLATTIFFTVYYGIMGAVVARILSRFMNLVVSLYLLRRSRGDV